MAGPEAAKAGRGVDNPGTSLIERIDQSAGKVSAGVVPGAFPSSFFSGFGPVSVFVFSGLLTGFRLRFFRVFLRFSFKIF